VSTRASDIVGLPVIVTYNQWNIDAIVESQASEKPADAKGPEGVGARGGDRGQKGDAVAGHQGWYPALVIGDPSEEEAADDGAAEEDGLCRRDEISLVAYPI